nr:hypothetical protein [Noviherbaspirillum saxi]
MDTSGRILALKGAGQHDAVTAIQPILLIHRLRTHQLVAQWLNQRRRQHGEPVLASFAAPDRGFPPLKVDIADSPLCAFHQPHSGAIQQSGIQYVRAFHLRKDEIDILSGQYGRLPWQLRRLRQVIDPG